MVNCGVPHCPSRRLQDKSRLMFYPIPPLNDDIQPNGRYLPKAARTLFKKRRAIWLSRIRKLGLLYEETKINVCSLHFVSGRPAQPGDEGDQDWAPTLLMSSYDQCPLERDPLDLSEGQASFEDQSILPDLSDCTPMMVQVKQEIDEDSEVACSSSSILDDGNSSSGFMGVHASENDGSDVGSVIKQECFDTIMSDNQSVKLESASQKSDVDFERLQSEYSELLKANARLKDKLSETEANNFEMVQSMSKLEVKCDNYAMECKVLKTKCKTLTEEMEKQTHDIKELGLQLRRAVHKRLEVEKELVKTKSCLLNFERLKGDDSIVMYYTGLATFKCFESLLSHVTAKVIDYNRTLTPSQSLLLTLIRLRLYLATKDVAYRFGISPKTISVCFDKWLSYLYTSLDSFISWPTREVDKSSIHALFKAAFGDRFVVIIGFIELLIEKPPPTGFNVEQGSVSEEHIRVKYMLGFTPTGAVCFVTQGWVQDSSYEHIAVNSGFFDKLLPGDLVLTDKSFPIGEKEGFFCAQVVTPTPHEGVAPLSSYEITDEDKKEALQVHVERAVDSVKMRFAILGKPLPSNFLRPATRKGQSVSQADELVWVCCALSNLSKGKW